MDNKTKLLVMRVLKTIFYLLGFPLFVFFVLKDSNAMQGSAFKSTAMIPVKVAVCIWAFVSLVKAGIVVLSGKRRAATTVAAVLAFILMFGGAFGIKTVARAKYDDAAANKIGNSSVASWGDQVGYYNNVTSSRGSMAKALTSDIEWATKLYNIGYEGEHRKRNAEDTPIHSAADDSLIQANADGNGNLVALDGETVVGTYTTEVEDFFGTQFTHYYLDVDDGYIYDAYPDTKLGFWYSYDYQSRNLETEEQFNEYCYGGIWYGKGTYNPNGTLADGWIFSLENALGILDDYYTALEFGAQKYGSNEAFIAAYKAALKDATEAQVADNGGMVGDDNFTANEKYLANVESAAEWGVTYSRANVIVKVLFDLVKNNTTLGQIDTISGLLSLVETMAGTLDLDGICNLLSTFGLSGDTLGGLVGGLGLDVDIPAGATISEAVEAILGGFDYILGYQSTVNKSAIDYISTGDEEVDEMMKRYGHSLYEGYNHGTFCGSVIIDPTGGTVGGGTFTMSQALTHADVQQLQTDLAYKPELYPMISMFRYMYAFCGVVLFSIIACGYLNLKIEKIEEEDK